MTRRRAKTQFLSHDRLRPKAKGVAYRVMVFEPKGCYPSGTFHVPNGLFHADGEISFSIVEGESWDAINPDAPYSEFNWASPQELRLIASLLRNRPVSTALIDPS